jgi:hypothetical protein
VLPLVIILLAAGVWSGAILFQSALVAPAVFGELDIDSARRVLRRLFPRFFVLGIGLTSLALIAAPFLQTDDVVRTWIMVTLVAMLAAIGVSLVLVPAINAAGDSGDRRRFGMLHGLSVILTLASLAGAIAVIALLAWGRG